MKDQTWKLNQIAEKNNRDLQEKERFTGKLFRFGTVQKSIQPKVLAELKIYYGFLF